jgi:integrase
VTLPKARELRDQARAMVRDGIDPGVERKQRAAETALSAETTFESVATAWHKAQQRRWKPRYAEQVLQRFEADVYPAIGSLPIQAISAALVLKVMRTIEAREAHEMAHRARQHISDVFVFAIASGWAEDDPAHVIRKALTPTSPRLRPAVTKLAAARRVLAQTEAQPAYAVTKLAARLVALTAARPGIVRMAAPEEFEALDSAMPIWRIPAAKMKLTRERRIDATYELSFRYRSRRWKSCASRWSWPGRGRRSSSGRCGTSTSRSATTRCRSFIGTLACAAFMCRMAGGRFSQR